MYVSSTLQELLVGFSSRRHLLLSSGAYRCTQRQMVVWSAGRARSISNSSASRYESESRKYHRTAQTIISGSKCRHLNSAGRSLIMEYAARYQIRSTSFATQPTSLQGIITPVAASFCSRVPRCARARRPQFSLVSRAQPEAPPTLGSYLYSWPWHLHRLSFAGMLP